MFMCDKPQIINNKVYFAFQKTIDGMGETNNSEIFIIMSNNLLDIKHDINNINYITLPDTN